MIDSRPKTVTISNLSAFFDFRNTGGSGIKPGMLRL